MKISAWLDTMAGWWLTDSWSWRRHTEWTLSDRMNECLLSHHALKAITVSGFLKISPHPLQSSSPSSASIKDRPNIGFLWFNLTAVYFLLFLKPCSMKTQQLESLMKHQWLSHLKMIIHLWDVTFSPEYSSAECSTWVGGANDLDD